MKTTLELMRELQKVSNKSKVKFSWNFEKELKSLMNQVEVAVKKYIIPKYRVEYTSYSNSSVKIKINDTDKSISKLITCNFTYNKTDERYWYVDPQILSSQISQKTKILGMGKFPILEKDRIVETFIKTLLAVIEEY